MSTPDVAAALDVLADAIAERVAARLRADARPGWIDQVASPLGRRRHCAAVRRLVAAGNPGAAVVGRRHLLAAAALADELARSSAGRGSKPKPQSVASELRRELSLVSGGRT